MAERISAHRLLLLRRGPNVSPYDGRVERGIWQHNAGVSRDTESDELFVVPTGRATIEVENGPTLEVAPGSVGLFRGGDRTTWRVHEDLRKIYQATED
jgi:hypothetical protein